MLAARLVAVVSLAVVMSVLAAAVTAAAQDPADIEASLALDRPTRVLIQGPSSPRRATLRLVNGQIVATVLTGAAVLVGVWRRVESVRRDLTAQIGDVRREIGDVRGDLGGQIGDVNQRIDNVLLADRRQVS